MMQASIPVKLNHTVPLHLQVYDGRIDLEVMAVIRDHNGNEIDRVALSHVGLGLYNYRFYLMPPHPQITATYIVMKNGVELEGEKGYERAIDIFHLDEAPARLEEIAEMIENGFSEMPFLVGMIEEELGDGFLEGFF